MVTTLPSNSVQTDLNAVNVEKTDKSAMREENQSAMREENQSALREVWQRGICAHCASEFQKKTTWQKYCNDSCRAMAYELRTGKKLNIAMKKN